MNLNLKLKEAFGRVEAQGPPRHGLLRYGMPVGGWFDQASAQLANVLSGRPPSSTCLELTMAKVAMTADIEFGFALAGAPCGVRIDSESSFGPGSYVAKAGSQVEIFPPEKGVRVYFAAAFENLPAVGSRLVAGSSIQVGDGQFQPKRLQLAEAVLAEGPLRVVRGPHFAIVEGPALLERSFTVSTRSDRVGLRLDQKVGPHQAELVSEPAGLGAVQITPDGTPILLGPDGPTIGGYPKGLYVISADWDPLGQLRPGQSVSFEMVEMEEARLAASERRVRLERRLAELRFAISNA